MTVFIDAAGVSAVCPSSDWLDAGNGQCYAVFIQSPSFSDALEAQKLCHVNGSELASIPDFDTESRVLELLRNTTVSYYRSTSHTTLFAIKGSNNKKQTKQRKRSKINHSNQFMFSLHRRHFRGYRSSNSISAGVFPRHQTHSALYTS